MAIKSAGINLKIMVHTLQYDERKPGSLMNKLIERVLSICTRLSPNNRTGLVVNFIAISSDVFSVRFHVSLLEVRGESMEVLVVGEHGVGLGAQEVGVPDSKESHGQGDV